MDEKQKDSNQNMENDHTVLVSTWVGAIVILIIAATVFLAFMKNFRDNPNLGQAVYISPQMHGDQMMGGQSGMFTQNGISLINPKPNATVSSPLSVLGFGLPAFEAVPGSLQILDANGKVLAQKQLSVTDLGQSEPNGFIASVDFSAKAGSKITLRIKNDNPSGLPANARSIDVPLVVGK